MGSANPFKLLKYGSKIFKFRGNPYSPLNSFVYAKIGIHRFFGQQAGIQIAKISKAGKKEAQVALLDYLHMTRGVRYLEAENMSCNSKFFMEQLLEKVVIKEQEIGRSVTRFLLFHPINEFEPFFESIGIHPSGIGRLLPRNLTFLSDDQALLHNYYILCDYGIPRDRIGKIYENSQEFFRCESKTLLSKLQAFSELGFSPPFSPLFLSRTPQILSEKAHNDSAEVINTVKSCGIEMNWVEKQLKDCRVFSWSTMLSVLKLFKAIGFTNEQLGSLIKEHPDIIFCRSGGATLSAVCFLSKFGLSLPQIAATLNQLDKVRVDIFDLNLRRFFLLFTCIKMDGEAIRYLFRTHTQLLGSCKIKKHTSLLGSLRVGKKRLRKIIMGNPEILSNWAVGRKLRRFAPEIETGNSKMNRENFIEGVGCERDSLAMQKMLRGLKGKVSELQRRFDFVVETTGLSRDEVSLMIRRYPQIFNQTIDVIGGKIEFFVEELKYPFSDLAKFPLVLCYASDRVRIRLAMFELHKTVRTRTRETSLCSWLACTEKDFINRYVRSYPNGLQVWEELKSKYDCR